MFKKKLAILIASLICMSAISYASVSAMEDNQEYKIDYSEPDTVDIAYSNSQRENYPLTSIFATYFAQILSALEQKTEPNYAQITSNMASNFDEMLENYFKLLNQLDKGLLLTYEEGDILGDVNVEQDKSNDRTLMRKVGIKKQHIKIRTEGVATAEKNIKEILNILKDNKYDLDNNTKDTLKTKYKDHIKTIEECEQKIEKIRKNKNINLDQDITDARNITIQLVNVLKDLINDLDNNQDIKKKLYCINELYYNPTIGRIVKKTQEIRYVIEIESKIKDVLDRNNITNEEKKQLMKNLYKIIDQKDEKFVDDGIDSKDKFKDDMIAKIPVSYTNIMKEIPNENNNSIYISPNLMQGGMNNGMMQQPAVNNLYGFNPLFNPSLLLYNMYQQPGLVKNNGMKAMQNLNNNDMNLITESKEEIIRKVKENVKRYLLEDKTRINKFEGIEDFLAESPEYKDLLKLIRSEVKKVEENIREVESWRGMRNLYKTFVNEENITQNTNKDLLSEYERDFLEINEEYKKSKEKMKTNLDRYKYYVEIYTSVLKGEKPENLLELFRQVNQKARQNIEGLNTEKYKKFIGKVYGMEEEDEKKKNIDEIKEIMTKAETSLIEDEQSGE